MLIFYEKLAKPTTFHYPISWGTATIIPLQLVLSRKIFKKLQIGYSHPKPLPSPLYYWTINSYSPPVNNFFIPAKLNNRLFANADLTIF
jgi:hypothetical protein